MKPLSICASVIFASQALCGVCRSAELGPGDALTRESAVPVISALSQDDLDQSVTAWVKSRVPGATVVAFQFEYIDDSHAFMVVRIIDGTNKRDLFFLTPGLPAQFVGRKR